MLQTPPKPLHAHTLKIHELNGSPDCQRSRALREGCFLVLYCHITPKVIRDAGDFTLD